jgi:hypothetical protein
MMVVRRLLNYDDVGLLLVNVDGWLLNVHWRL